MDGKITVKHVDSFEKSYSESGLGINNFEDILNSESRLSTATVIDNFGRQLISLSKDSFKDVEISAKINVASDTVTADVGDWEVIGNLYFDCMFAGGAKRLNSKLGAKFASLFDDSKKETFISQVNDFGLKLANLLEEDITYTAVNPFGEAKITTEEIIGNE